MTEYSVAEISAHAAILRDWRNGFDPGIGNDDAADMLTAYADLREQIERAREGVTDEVVHEAIEAYLVSDDAAEVPRFDAMRAALQSVAHLLPSERGGVDESAVNKTGVFEREDRYYVIKKSHHSEDQLTALDRLFDTWKIRTVQCVVVEADWPEHEHVWAMIKARMTGQPAQAEHLDTPLETRVEFALRDAGFGLDEASNIAALATHPPAQAAHVDDAWRDAAADILGKSSNLYRMLCQQAAEYASKTPTAEPVAQGGAVVFKHPAAVRSAAAFLLAKFDHAPCDNSGFSCCIRCRAVAMSRWAIEALDSSLAAPPSTPNTTGAIGENGNG
jgi:hypothetical protein